ncbi:MAG: lmo0937 family membrane protein [Candidatus Angelobacter sp. Gp1-AA117]|nr:MAG: lmo0937 family membrane protein [Candidatus Angelobacter sp. Gp1-AA117]
MLWLILAILAILWMLGSNINFAGGLVHLLLISALILIVLRLLRGRHRIW